MKVVGWLSFEQKIAFLQQKIQIKIIIVAYDVINSLMTLSSVNDQSRKVSCSYVE